MGLINYRLNRDDIVSLLKLRAVVGVVVEAGVLRRRIRKN